MLTNGPSNNSPAITEAPVSSEVHVPLPVLVEAHYGCGKSIVQAAEHEIAEARLQDDFVADKVFVVDERGPVVAERRVETVAKRLRRRGEDREHGQCPCQAEDQPEPCRA